MGSPAQNYARARERTAHPALTEFANTFPFPLDPFQREACRSLENGSSTLVCAPTGSGKTVVGEFAVHLALRAGAKCFYTTPIKALSNQKFRDLGERFGVENVGLLTGDTVINSGAPVVVMTTEVLRNMLYAGSNALTNLRWVVLDEVHYLGDRFRGAVWEEVIIHLPESVQIAALSATVSNAEEFGDWLATVRGDTDVVLHEQRPVPLWQHMMVGHRLFDLFSSPATHTVDPSLQRYINERAGRMDTNIRARGRSRYPNQRATRGWRPPDYPDVLERLDRDGLLPAITFIFSRAGCDAAVRQCLNAGLTLTEPSEREEIRRIAETRTSDLSGEDLAALGYFDWIDGLTRGVAAHHAGLIPVFKETVEELFTRGLVRAVFATETLALGINMPARTVVLDKLRKFDGDTHNDITPGEYTQLTGRAGRRGIDIEGHAVVVWSPAIDPAQVAGLASTRTYPLKSSFRPSYNMAVNLIASVGRPAARELLESSFAQFQADRGVVGLVRQMRRLEGAVSEGEAGLACERGNFAEYAELRHRLKELENESARNGRNVRRAETVTALEDLERGDVIAVPSGKRAGWAVVVESAHRASQGDPRVLVVTEDRWSGRLSSTDFLDPPTSVATARVPKNFDQRSPQARRDMASTLRALDLGPVPRGSRRRAADGTEDPRIASLRRQIRDHPCHACPDREEHARIAERVIRTRRELDTQRARVEGRTNTLARTFDRICDLLAESEFLTAADDPGQTAVTPAGRMLARIWGESDLLTALCLREGVWDGLGPADLAAAVSTLVYEARREDEEEPQLPQGRLRDAIAETVAIWANLTEAERAHVLPTTRPPDPGFVTAVRRWASGQSLAKVLPTRAGESRTAGDFVRWCRQVIDLLDQIAQAAPSEPIAPVAAQAVQALRRGVVLS